MLNIKQFEAKAAAVGSLVEDARNALPDNDLGEDLYNNFSELWSMILSSIEIHDGVLSDVEK